MAFTLDVSHSEALQWVHNCCHPGMLRVLEDKRVTAVIVLDTAVCAESTINPVHLTSYLWPTGGLCERGSLRPGRTMYGRTQLFMDISYIALDELADFQPPPKKQAVDSFTSDPSYTGICHRIDRCMHTKRIPRSPLHFLYNLSPNVFALLACQNPGPASVFPSLSFLSPGCPSSCWNVAGSAIPTFIL